MVSGRIPLTNIGAGRGRGKTLYPLRRERESERSMTEERKSSPHSSSPLELSAPWAFRERFEVTFRDLDLAGHVNNSVVFTWMETLRLHHYMLISGLEDPSSIDFILAEVQARYLVPVRYKHKVIGEVAPSRVGKSSWELLYRFLDEPTQTLLMRARSVQVSFDYPHQSKKPLSPSVRERLLRDQVAPETEGWPKVDRSS
jgi:acyl-CoA thioester hydrolase